MQAEHRHIWPAAVGAPGIWFAASSKQQTAPPQDNTPPPRIVLKLSSRLKEYADRFERARGFEDDDEYLFEAVPSPSTTHTPIRPSRDQADRSNYAGFEAIASPRGINPIDCSPIKIQTMPLPGNCPLLPPAPAPINVFTPYQQSFGFHQPDFSGYLSPSPVLPEYTYAQAEYTPVPGSPAVALPPQFLQMYPLHGTSPERQQQVAAATDTEPTAHSQMPQRQDRRESYLKYRGNDFTMGMTYEEETISPRTKVWTAAGYGADDSEEERNKQKTPTSSMDGNVSEASSSSRMTPDSSSEDREEEDDDTVRPWTSQSYRIQMTQPPRAEEQTPRIRSNYETRNERASYARAAAGYGSMQIGEKSSWDSLQL